MPQGSVLKLLLYSLYTTPILSTISKFPDVNCHFYTGNHQMCLSFHLSILLRSKLKNPIFENLSEVLMIPNELSINPTKTVYFFDAKLLIFLLTKLLFTQIQFHRETAKKLCIIFQSDMSTNEPISPISLKLLYYLHHLRNYRLKSHSLHISSFGSLLLLVYNKEIFISAHFYCCTFFLESHARILLASLWEKNSIYTY